MVFTQNPQVSFCGFFTDYLAVAKELGDAWDGEKEEVWKQPMFVSLIYYEVGNIRVAPFVKTKEKTHQIDREKEKLFSVYTDIDNLVERTIELLNKNQKEGKQNA